MGLEQCIFYASPLPLSCEKTSNTQPLEQFLLADTFQEMLFLFEEHFLFINSGLALYEDQNTHNG